MGTIKSFTDISQSKKLAEILPLESADMYYERTTEEPEFKIYVGGNIAIKMNLFSYRNGHVIPCWSCAALISILPDEIKHDGIVNNLWITSESASYYSKEYDSYLYCEEGCTVDACYELILKLHEQKLL